MATLRKGRTSVLRSGESVAHATVDRQCAAPGCLTRLSRYNPQATCSIHAGWQDPPKSRRGQA
jgi:hypothetical protein